MIDIGHTYTSPLFIYHLRSFHGSFHLFPLSLLPITTFSSQALQLDITTFPRPRPSYH
ncbi:hypothetical protein P167DRAFT_539327 [Morchella conica CCBAS932]|uniref:Uncharacterized protein n=1 Tax=Morchella conica CCBAS932 TaxID=1392247 RepID=A0A3N4KGA3_9PEZI|nr:hypothetical protein P167DRAFT_539327 [Morchella conica CCBAS932]